MNNKKISVKKEMKRNSYEYEKETNGVTHLKQAPQPHGVDHRITEDVE